MEVCVVSTLLSSLFVFSKGGNGEAEAQTQASLPALRGGGAWWRKAATEQAESVEGRLAFREQGLPRLCVILRTLTSSVMESLQEGTTELCLSTNGDDADDIPQLLYSQVFGGFTDVPGT